MKNLHLIIIASIFIAFSCTKDKLQSNVDYDCLESQLEEWDMIPYTGQELGCKFFVTLSHYEGKQYYTVGNHCADMATFHIDCDGNTLCETEYNLACENYMNHALHLGLVGIQD